MMMTNGAANFQARYFGSKLLACLTTLAAVVLVVSLAHIWNRSNSAVAELSMRGLHSKILNARGAAQHLKLKASVKSIKLTPSRVLRHGRNVDSHFSLISNFLKDQSALDNTNSVQMFNVEENRNLADGYGLAAKLQQDENVADGSSHGGSLPMALKSADAVLAAAGFGDATNRRDALIGHRRSRDIMRDMELSGGHLSRNSASLKRALLLSQQELDKVLRHDNDNKQQNMGLSTLALDSVTQGMKAGLGVYRRDPIDGEGGNSRNSLALVDDAEVDRMANKEIRSVAAGKVPIQGTLVGLGQRP